MSEKITSDSKSQHEHAQEVRQSRADTNLLKAEVEATKHPNQQTYNRLMKAAALAKPSWFGQTSAAEHNTFASPKNHHHTPKHHEHHKPHHKHEPKSTSGLDGGSITFFVCKDNGDNTTTAGKVTVVGTFVAT